MKSFMRIYPVSVMEVCWIEGAWFPSMDVSLRSGCIVCTNQICLESDLLGLWCKYQSRWSYFGNVNLIKSQSVPVSHGLGSWLTLTLVQMCSICWTQTINTVDSRYSNSENGSGSMTFIHFKKKILLLDNHTSTFTFRYKHIFYLFEFIQLHVPSVKHIFLI